MAKSVSQLKNQARREEQRENWSRAIELYREAIRRSEETGEVSLDLSLYNRVGDLYRRQGETDRAVHFYHEAVERYADQGLHTGAIALCNKILRLAPDRVEVHRSLGRLHAATGLVAEARNSFGEYCSRLEEEGEHAKVREARLELARLVDDRDLLLETADAMVDEGREETALEALVGWWEDARGADEEAPEIRSRIEELDPDALAGEEDEAGAGAGGEEAAAPDDGAADGDGRAEPSGSEQDSAPTDTPEEGATEGTSDLSDILLELDEAEPEAGGEDAGPEGMEAPDEDAEVSVHLRYAEVLEESGRTEAALQQLESVLENFLSDGRHEPALEVVEKLLELAPDRPAYLRRRAEILEATGAEEEAVEAWTELARRLGGSGSERARTAYERVLELDPDHEAARDALEGSDAGEAGPEEDDEDLGELLQELDAEPDAAAGTEGRESDADAEEPGGTDRGGEAGPAEDAAGQGDRGYVDLGERIRGRLEAEREAAEASGEAGEYDFDDMLVGFRAQVQETSGEADPEAHVELGVALRQMGQLDDAIREFQVATRSPEPPLRAFELLGEAFVQKELYSVAVRVLNRALHIPGHPDHELLGILYQLGVAHQEVGDAREALDCYERIYSVDIDFRDVAERMETVRAEA